MDRIGSRSGIRFFPDQFIVHIRSIKMLLNANTAIPDSFWMAYHHALTNYWFDVVAPNGTIWHMNANTKRQGSFDGQWMEFCSSNQVEIGDSIVFGRIAPFTFIATIFSSHGNQRAPSALHAYDLHHPITPPPETSLGEGNDKSLQAGSGSKKASAKRKAAIVFYDYLCINDKSLQAGDDAPLAEAAAHLLNDDNGGERMCFTLKLPEDVKERHRLEFPVQQVAFLKMFKTYEWPMTFEGRVWLVKVVLDEERERFVLDVGWSELAAHREIIPGNTLCFEVHYQTRRIMKLHMWD